MIFPDKKEEFKRTIDMVSLFLSMGAVFFQIWVLVTSIDAYFKGNIQILFPLAILSGLGFLLCCLGVLLTNLNLLKGITEGRTNTYLKNF